MRRASTFDEDIDPIHRGCRGIFGRRRSCARATTLPAHGLIAVRARSAALAASAGPARAEPHEPATDNALAIICGIVEELAAKDEGCRSISSLGSSGKRAPSTLGAISPAGAQGVAQFMPGTAFERGLADPFDPAAAIPASAKLLAELAHGSAISAWRRPPTTPGRTRFRLDRRPRLHAARDAGLCPGDHRP